MVTVAAYLGTTVTILGVDRVLTLMSALMDLTVVTAMRLAAIMRVVIPVPVILATPGTVTAVQESMIVTVARVRQGLV